MESGQVHANERELKLEVGSLKLEVGSWKAGDGREILNYKFLMVVLLRDLVLFFDG